MYVWSTSRNVMLFGESGDISVVSKLCLRKKIRDSIVFKFADVMTKSRVSRIFPGYR